MEDLTVLIQESRGNKKINKYIIDKDAAVLLFSFH